MKKQKFKKGDLVHIAKDLGPHRSHFTADVDAIVIASYKDQYGGDNTKDYTLRLKGEGECSWYDEDRLTLIESSRFDLLDKWTQDEDEEADMKGQMDWIFQNGESVLRSAHGASVSALAQCFGVTNLWGSMGEGFTYFINCVGTIRMAEPFLKNGDKQGWLDYCESIKRQ